MDLSFEEENNLNLPDPTGKLDFTEDEDVHREGGHCAGTCDQQCGNQQYGNPQYDHQQCNDQQCDDQQCDDQADISMNDADESESDIEDSTGSNVEPIEFSRPLVNQNLMLNRKPAGNAAARNAQFAGRPNAGLQEPVTPALIKRKQFKQWFNSPTDNCMSPCTQKILKQKKPI